jgi:hypothetical protein
MSKERYDEALDMLSHYHAGGDRTNQTVQFEYHEIKETLQIELQHKKSGSYLDFIRTKGNRYRLMLLVSLGLISQYSGNALFSNYSNLIYESTGVTNQQQKLGVSIFHAPPRLFAIWYLGGFLWIHPLIDVLHSWMPVRMY